jgi:predicted nuclease of restriction endonuclease-like (RecB) superfamily
MNSSEYKQWIVSIKEKVRQAQLKAAISVNEHLLEFYWELGSDIVEKQKNANWGDGFLKQLSHDLLNEFPDIKGFSLASLQYIRRWYLFYSQNSGTACSTIEKIKYHLFKIPWGHNLAIVSKCKTIEQAVFYIQKTIQNNWSRSILIHQIESGLFRREGKSITNFSETLPFPQSELAQQILKDPYNFDFLTLTKDYNERDLERALIEHITHFLLELGTGFAYIGKQVPIQAGERDFFLDLLFYHTRLHCYIVIELKTGNFEPEYAGKLNFYIKAVDQTLRNKADSPSIGLLLCKNKDNLVAEWALSDIHKPIGVSEYELTQVLPEKLKPSLPSIKEIEEELRGNIRQEASES